MSLYSWDNIKPLSNKNAVEDFENKYGLSFPQSFKECVAYNNGGRPHPNSIMSAGGKGFDVKMLLSYNEEDIENIYDVIDYFIKNYNKRLIPFASDSAGNYYCFENEKIVLWTQDEDEIYICDSFSSFVEGLYDLDDVFCNSREAFSTIQREILGNVKVPHGTSQPVLYKENGNYYLAAYVFFYTREDIENGAVDRPTVWAIADIRTGKIIKRFKTKEKDFSDAPYDVKYNIRSDEKYDISAEYYQKAFAILDSVREKLVETGKFYELEYKYYLDKIVANIPAAYKRFLYDLSV